MLCVCRPAFDKKFNQKEPKINEKEPAINENESRFRVLSH